MIVIDTSIWISALRDADSREAVQLAHLLDEDYAALVAPVRTEILSGSTRSDVRRFRALLSALPCWFPTHSTWERIESWIEPALAAGERFGIVDLLIAGIAADHGARLWSLDRDFERLARLHLVELHSPN